MAAEVVAITMEPKAVILLLLAVEVGAYFPVLPALGVLHMLITAPLDPAETVVLLEVLVLKQVALAAVVAAAGVLLGVMVVMVV